MKFRYDKHVANHRSYRCEPPHPFEEIEANIKTLEGEIVSLLREVVS